MVLVQELDFTLLSGVQQHSGVFISCQSQDLDTQCQSSSLGLYKAIVAPV